MNKVLIVEDNEMNLDMLSRRLARKGFEISAARNGQDALTLANEIQPDIILMDMSLPIMDGWEATRHLKKSPDTCSIPVIGLSAHARETDISRGKEAGCDAYETKPVDLTRLLTTIENFITL